jgi:lysophospholipase L1-like esterase
MAYVARTSRRPTCSQLTECVGGFLGIPVAVTTNPYSVMQQSVLPADFDAVQIGILNASNTSVAGIKVAVAAGTTLGPANGTLGLNASGFPFGTTAVTSATFGGNATGTIPAAAATSTGATGANIGGSDCGIVWTDWITCPSQPRADGNSLLPTINVFLTYPAGVQRSFLEMDGTTSVLLENEGDAQSAPFNRPVRVMVAAASDAIANPAFMLASNGFCARNYTQFPPILIRFLLRNGEGETLVVYGDSIAEGSGASHAKIGWPRRFQAKVSTMDSPVAVCNLAVSGSNMNNFDKRIKATLPSFARASVYCPSLSPNSLSAPINQASITLCRGSFASILSNFDKPAITFFTSTCLPTNYSVKPYGTSDITYRVPWNHEKRLGNFKLADFASVIAGPIDGNGQYTMQPALTADGIHPNNSGYEAMANEFLTIWNKV